MVKGVKKPIEDVITAILEYKAPEHNLEVFVLKGSMAPQMTMSGSMLVRTTRQNGLFFEADLKKPKTFEGSEYLLIYKYHAEKGEDNPSDPSYLNEELLLANLHRVPQTPDFTKIIFYEKYRTHSHYREALIRFSQAVKVLREKK